MRSTSPLGPELLLALVGSRSRPLRAQLESGLREAIREGRLAPGARMPSSRALAADLGLSRSLVVQAYEQLLAEGYLTARRGAGTFVAHALRQRLDEPRAAAPAAPRYDFFPGAPDLAAFPRARWLRALRDVLRTAPPSIFAYPDVRGLPELRFALADYLRRARAVIASGESVMVSSGATQALALLARALVQLGHREIAVEDPCLPAHRALFAAAGLRVVGVAVDEQGAQVEKLSAPVLLCAPAHQLPTGVVLSPRRRGALLAWVRQGGLLIEDDYDAELRYDRRPLAALQGLAPDRVIYVGSASKTLSPALRIGWVVLPEQLRAPFIQARLVDDLGSAALPQLALAHLLEHAEYDRHLRALRRRYRLRRAALADAVARHLSGCSLSGADAGLHALLHLPGAVDAEELLFSCEQAGVRVYPLSMHLIEQPPSTDAVALGYGNLTASEIELGIRALAGVLARL
ncbi:MAG TPA: PLP-dependent aminotransferase family protein [Solirubrobacteraceae bacterium]|nr:PLP-dependent aminotransferase family protein [Solirubrobacteraceae bacterium]